MTKYKKNCVVPHVILFDHYLFPLMQGKNPDGYTLANHATYLTARIDALSRVRQLWKRSQQNFRGLAANHKVYTAWSLSEITLCTPC